MARRMNPITADMPGRDRMTSAFSRFGHNCFGKDIAGAKPN